jgi:hypothetical protein
MGISVTCATLCAFAWKEFHFTLGTKASPSAVARTCDIDYMEPESWNKEDTSKVLGFKMQKNSVVTEMGEFRKFRNFRTGFQAS